MSLLLASSKKTMGPPFGEPAVQVEVFAIAFPRPPFEPRGTLSPQKATPSLTRGFQGTASLGALLVSRSQRIGRKHNITRVSDGIGFGRAILLSVCHGE